MAVTQGHGNPTWSRDETILALELYHQCGDAIPGPGDPRVIALSQLLRALPIHPVLKRRERFRNPAGVAFKLQNLRRVATGRGLDHSSRTDGEVWHELGANTELVRDMAKAIRDKWLRGEAPR